MYDNEEGHTEMVFEHESKEFVEKFISDAEQYYKVKFFSDDTQISKQFSKQLIKFCSIEDNIHHRIYCERVKHFNEF